MTSEVKNTLRGLKAFVPVAENPDKIPSGELAARVSAILSPDTATALKKRSSSMKQSDTINEDALAKPEIVSRIASTSSRGGRRKKDHPTIDLNAPTFASEIKTTSVMADEVTNILGTDVLGALKASCEGRKQQEQLQQAATKKANSQPKISKLMTPEMVAAMQNKSKRVSSNKNSSLLTPEMMEAMSHTKEGKGVAPQAKKAGRNAGKASGGEEGEHEKDRNGRSRRHHKDGKSRTNKSSGDVPIQRKNKSPRQSKSSDEATQPSGRKSKHLSKEQRPQKKAQELVNHAENVGIDLEDGMDEIFDTLDLSEKESKPVKQGMSPKQRVRKSRRDQPSSGGGGGAHRGRNGRRARGHTTNIQQEQMAQLTSMEHEQYREEDFICSEESPEESGPENTEDVEIGPDESEDLFGFGNLANAARGTAAATANLAVGAATGAAGTVLNVGTNVVSTAGGTVLNVGNTALNVGNTALNTLSTAATTFGKTTTDAATAATNSLRNASQHDKFDDSSSEGDEPEQALATDGDATWGFTGGGLPS